MTWAYEAHQLTGVFSASDGRKRNIICSITKGMSIMETTLFRPKMNVSQEIVPPVI